MNKKIIIIISILILIVSIMGLLTSQENSSNKNSQPLPVIKKLTYSFLVTSRDLHKGEIIDASDVNIQTIEDDEGMNWDERIVNKNKDFITNSIVLRDLKKGDYISSEDVARPGSETYHQLKANPKKGLFSFSFELNKREYLILSKLKPNEVVDIYFKYETRNKKSIPVLPKRNPNQSYSSEGNANSSNLALMFSNKRVLFLEKIPPISEEHPNKSKPIANLQVELSEEEIKQIYTIEDLGIFVIFPASKKQKEGISTANVLTKDFIKELKGGIDAKSDSY
ncbi:hypothetical protein BKH42_05120 [Helicobacter sp. 13S00482-2]|uniref:SAF domain-containing protein n=1 Tax=Helicobacter sp. 13S00482-2 TaxID=1476200 RepID=UPI000BA67A6A|nr:SAF domain-containing protein [Helicobacter sp. 13S00482-2]PAF53565.1 hypothetical protein BKH42_05120 [Helicobacter sp. 13S00482-2]